MYPHTMKPNLVLKEIRKDGNATSYIYEDVNKKKRPYIYDFILSVLILLFMALWFGLIKIN